MYLKTKQVREFLSLISSINTRGILPVLGYIKLQDGKLTKTSLDTYVIHKIDAPENEALLLSEEYLSSFVKECSREEFEIKADEKVVWLIDGKRKNKFQSASVNEFPNLPDISKEETIEFDSDTLSSLGVARKNVSNSGIGMGIDFVHILKNHVISGDHHKLYFRKCARNQCPFQYLN